MAKNVLIVIGLLIGLPVIGTALYFVGNGLWLVGETTGVVREELGPRALLRKYEWFKDQAAAINSTRAKIVTAESVRDQLAADYGDDRTKWPADVRQDHSLRSQETFGLKNKLNSMSAEYNAQMAKANYAFCNVGEMPAGLPLGLEPLPRGFSEYTTK